MAHEISHYLGLNHVCEAPIFNAPDGMVDPLTDTACDTHNLMYPEIGGGNFRLSPQQLEVIKNHPAIQ